MVNFHILLIEDDPDISCLIAETLWSENYEVDVAENGLDGISYLKKKDYHAVILDLMLPDLDGIDVLRHIRESRNVPVIILTAREEETDLIAGLSTGADDYMTKPFSIPELKARLQAHMRRYLYLNAKPDQPEAILVHGELCLNRNSHELSIKSEVHKLTSKEFKILELMMSYPTKIFSKSQLFRSVWGDDSMSDENTVMVHIRRLRRKIEPDPSKPRYLQTVWGIGYRLHGGGGEES